MVVCVVGWGRQKLGGTDDGAWLEKLPDEAQGIGVEGLPRGLKLDVVGALEKAADLGGEHAEAVVGGAVEHAEALKPGAVWERGGGEVGGEREGGAVDDGGVSELDGAQLVGG